MIASEGSAGGEYAVYACGSPAAKMVCQCRANCRASRSNLNNSGQPANLLRHSKNLTEKSACKATNAPTLHGAWERFAKAPHCHTARSRVSEDAAVDWRLHQPTARSQAAVDGFPAGDR